MYKLLMEYQKTLYGSVVVLLSGAALAMAFWPRSGELDHLDTHRRMFVYVEQAVSGNKVQIDTDGETDDGYVLYAGIRAPRSNEPFFEEALERNSELIKEKTVRLRFGKERYDRKGRQNAYVFIDNDFINEILVREGLAYVRLTTTVDRFADRLLAAQADARKHKRGFWKSRTFSHEATYPADPKYGNFHRPSCEESSKINPSRLIVFKSAKRAIEKGFAPCAKCQP